MTFSIKYFQCLKVPLLDRAHLFFPLLSYKYDKAAFLVWLYGNWSSALDSGHACCSIISWLMVSHCAYFLDTPVLVLGPQIHFSCLSQWISAIVCAHISEPTFTWLLSSLEVHRSELLSPCPLLVRFHDWFKVESTSRTKLLIPSTCFR